MQTRLMAIAVAVALSGITAAGANAAALTGETLTGTVAFDTTQCGLSFGDSIPPSTYTFTASGTATGPYNGPFTETGSATATANELLIGFSVTNFTITDTVKGMVTGTMMFSAPSPSRDNGLCTSDIPTDTYINAPAGSPPTGSYPTGITYTAQTPDCTDHGSSTAVQAFADDGRGSSSFAETFASTGCTPNQATPTITSQASAPVVVGGSISDTATLAGGASPTGTITFNAYGPNDATCSGTPASTSTATVTGNGPYPSAQYTTSAPGTYRWVAAYSGDANNTAASTSCNDANESVTVNQATPTITTQASAPVAVGGSISDTATLAGAASPTGTITFNLYGPNDATCSGTPASTSIATVTGNGTYPSGSFTTPAPGTYRWVASYSGDANNTAASATCNDANESVTVVAPRPPIGQSITFTSVPPAAPMFGGSYSVAATGGGSGNPVIFSIDAASAGGACSVSGSTVSFTGLGLCVIDADQAGNSGYDPAPQAQQSFTIAQASQSISFPTAPALYGQPDFSPASAGSGLAVSYSSPIGQCAIDAQGLVQVTGVGSCTITASQSGNVDYQAATPVTQTLTINQAPLLVNANDATVVFGQTPMLGYSLAGFVNGENASTAGVTGSATCSASPPSQDVGTYPGAITCSPGTLSAPSYMFISNASGTLAILPAAQSIAFPSGPVVYGQFDFSPALASSGLPVSYTNPSGQCAVDPQGLVQITGAGSCTITANQGGSLDYQAATPVTQTFTIDPAQLFVNAYDAAVTFGQTPTLGYSLAGFVNGENTTTANVMGSASCTTHAPSQSPGTYPGAIICTPGGLQASNYQFMTGTGGTLTIGQASQSISFPSGGGTYGQADFSPATASSGLPVSYSNPVGQCAVDAQGLVQITGAGSCTITANQAGNADYQPATPVTQTFTIGQAPLFVNANDATVVFGQTPVIGYSLAGFVNGENATSAGVSGSADCAALPPSPDPGTYPGAITCAPGTLSAPNYTFYANASGTLTITQAAQSISFPATAVLYTHADFSPASASSKLPITYTSPAGRCAIDPQGLVQITGVGACTITANQSGNTDYQPATPVTRTFTIIGPPTAQIDSPAGNQTYTQGQTVATAFSCSDSPGGPGIASCIDSNHAGGGSGTLDTSALGSYSYTVTARSSDGLTGTATIQYHVVSAGFGVHHLVWSPSPVAPATSLAPGASTDVSVIPYGADGNPVNTGGRPLLVFVSLKRARGSNATASCGATQITAAGVFCPLDVPHVKVHVTYRRSSRGGEDGSDVLTAALDPYGTEQAQDLYTYAAPVGTPIDHLVWSPRPIAPARTLQPGQTAVATVTALSSHDNPIPFARVNLLLSRAAGSDATADSSCGTISHAAPGTLCTTGPDGTIQITYHAPSQQLDGGSDALTATGGFPNAQAQDLYTFQ